VDDPGPRRPAAPVTARDGALARLRRARRWLAIASFAGAGIVAGLAAQAKPGKSTASSTSAGGAKSERGHGSAASVSTGSNTGATASGGATQLSPPPAAPAPAPAAPAPVTSSGGS
jgi:hypothetical protein